MDKMCELAAIMLVIALSVNIWSLHILWRRMRVVENRHKLFSTRFEEFKNEALTESELGVVGDYGFHHVLKPSGMLATAIRATIANSALSTQIRDVNTALLDLGAYWGMSRVKNPDFPAAQHVWAVMHKPGKRAKVTTVAKKG